MTLENARIANLTMSITINAPVESVWTALTAHMNDWWPDSFFGGGEAGQRAVVLECEPGGKMFERWETGGGLVWGNVVTIDPNKTLQILGHQFPNWGGPSSWFGTWDLSAVDGGTKLEFSESAVGRLSEGYVDDKDKGWKFLWASLKAHLEGSEPPVWSD